MAKHNRNNKKKGTDFKGGDTIYKKIILDFLSLFPQQLYTLKEISDATELFQVISQQKIRSILKDLAETGKVAFEGKNRYRLGGLLEEATGRIEVTRQGYGFVIQENGDDIFVPQRNLGSVLNGDTVRVRVLNSFSREGKRMGEVIEVISRSRNEFVGTLQLERNGQFYVIPDDNNIQFDFLIKKSDLNGAIKGDKVYIQVKHWDKRNPEGIILEVLGKAGEHNTEMHAILMHYGFNPKFPREVEEFADNIKDGVTPEEVAKRWDFREVTTFTIDPVDAKDFDDAISFRKLEEGWYEIGVHIADVSFYLKPGTVMDTEAFKRATSVYLVDRTVPMLPEKLSNFLCSLRPNEDKLTYSGVFELNEKGEIRKEWFGRTVIHSDHRFSYESAQETMDSEEELPLQEELRTLNKIAKNLRKARMMTGSVDFDTDEVRFELDENDKPIRLYVKERRDTHKLIEDFMLLANKRVATFVAKMFDNPPLTFVYRIHDLPDPEKLLNLQTFILHFGYKMNIAESKDPSDALAKLMTAIDGKPEQNIIERVAIRSMSKAVYSVKNIGHFGLGFDFYSHFTSPIRRYPDVMVHRLLTQYLDKNYGVNRQKLEVECEHCSRMEKTAAEAERTSIKFKQVEFMTEQIGKEFEGVISGVKENGFYVEMTDTLCEGMVPIWTIDEYFDYDAGTLTLTGRQSRKVFRMGDEVKVRVVRTNLQKRTIDLEWISDTVVEKLHKKSNRR
ncbi:MAG: ribonuclease R [Bacteroidia bacterium]|nr:ribonuclease R [Bacteroidia bacterium]